VQILIIDDSAAMRMMVKRMLRLVGLDGADVIEANDGDVGLAKILEEEPDLVLCDWNMPTMTGIEVLESLADEDVDPIFGFITTEASQEMRERATNAGARFLIAKPFTEDSVREALGPYAD